MRIAFYAPLKAPTHPVPSGDRRVARLLVQAMEAAGHQVELASSLRSFDGQGNLERQLMLQTQGREQARQLIAQWRGRPAAERPALWMSYHLYYKAPDWIGPIVCEQLGLPYVVCEASYAPKRATGAWRLGHESVGAAIAQADLLLAPTPEDVACLQKVATAPGRIQRFPPFLDASVFAQASRGREQARTALAAELGLDRQLPWLLTVGMMRPGDKLASYSELAGTLTLLQDLSWQILVVGDGLARAQVRELIERAAPGRARFLGLREAEEMPVIYAAADLCVWPAVNEAYGMALLEAQAAGLPVVACAVRGVPEVVCHDQTGLLAAPGDTEALARALRLLLTDAGRRRQMGVAASAFVQRERGIEQAALWLDALLQQVVRGRTPARPTEARP